MLERISEKVSLLFAVRVWQKKVNSAVAGANEGACARETAKMANGYGRWGDWRFHWSSPPNGCPA
ncbi:hypothetical protein BRCON_1625 [Candidatus Sumerlaea chitinivorans]|uniref:Uncharacterized protein n=1 Tax=Sumerlaea chitinivorans TaxID=2250252 RepID=A0A2Z4Y6R9_SUMC1|nr:hypothetical protein BRCON_1625 [Candidatus Sumerlaea chitinivorans]